MATVIYLCPRTGFKVQGWIADEPDPSATSVSVDCLICNSIHLVTPVAGDKQSNTTENRELGHDNANE
jgi:hypothetical protein